jgi:L-threonylcarbamoyladenylate synthase
MQAYLSDSHPPIWTVDPDTPSEKIIKEAAQLIIQGGVVVYPTETLYALGGHPMLKKSIRRIFDIKGRDTGKPLPLIAAGAEDVRKVVDEWPAVAERLAKSLWPGPLTLILASSEKLPSELNMNTRRIAVRISPHPVAVTLAAAVGGLLISTSANISGQPAITDPNDISPDLLLKVDGLIECGKIRGGGGLPSTVVDVSAEPPRLVRKGCISWESIQEVLNL